MEERIEVMHCDEEQCTMPKNDKVVTERIEVVHDPHQHRDGEYGIGSSKAQHFIQHIRDVDLTLPGWRDKQEEFAEQAQLSVCDELECPVCRQNCKYLTTHHWDTNRILQGQSPKSDDYLEVQKMICNASGTHR